MDALEELSKRHINGSIKDFLGFNDKTPSIEASVCKCLEGFLEFAKIIKEVRDDLLYPSYLNSLIFRRGYDLDSIEKTSEGVNKIHDKLIMESKYILEAGETFNKYIADISKLVEGNKKELREIKSNIEEKAKIKEDEARIKKEKSLCFKLRKLFWSKQN